MTELASLIESMCHGTATHADRDRLEKLLRDPANRAEYLAATRLHSELLWRWHRGRIDVVRPTRGRQASAPATRAAAPTNARPAVRHRFAAAVATARDATVSWLRFLTRPAPFACLVAASALGAFLVTAGVLSIGQSGDPTFAAAARQVRPIVARVTGLHAVRWPSRRDAWRDWDALPKGSRIDVAAGLVQVTHLDGANVVIEGPASYQVLSPTTGRLIRGRLAARTEHDEPTVADDRPASAVPDGTPLFTVITPQRLVHDLGTEFGVEVQESGDTGVHVFEGLVELAAVDRATAKNEVPVRLGAGESAGIDEAGNVSSGVAMARRIVRALPKPKQHPQAAEWSDAIAEVIYRDEFSGSGPLQGATPASRQGVGTVAWAVTPQSWGEMQMKDGSPRLAIAGGGAATLPFVPEPGHLYRLSVVVDVTAGDHYWAAAGFIDPSAPFTEQDPFNYAWFGQRQKNNPGLSPPYDFNMHLAGPSRNVRLRGDPFVGEQRRAIILDTSTLRWSVQFLVGGRLVGRHVYAANPTGIQWLGIGSYGSTTRATFRSFVLERNIVPPSTDEPAVAARQREIDQ